MFTLVLGLGGITILAQKCVLRCIGLCVVPGRNHIYKIGNARPVIVVRGEANMPA